jgi:hypothetical protein
MKKMSTDQRGFIPLLLTVLAIVLALIIVAYLRVERAHNI